MDSFTYGPPIICEKGQKVKKIYQYSFFNFMSSWIIIREQFFELYNKLKHVFAKFNLCDYYFITRLIPFYIY